MGIDRLGIGAVIGGGIFVITGQTAADHAGPAIILSFISAAIRCGFCRNVLRRICNDDPAVGQFLFVCIRHARRVGSVVH